MPILSLAPGSLIVDCDKTSVTKSHFFLPQSIYDLNPPLPSPPLPYLG